GVLDHDAVELTGVDGVDQDGAGVEPDELDLPGAADVLQRQQHPDGGRLVGGKDPLQHRAVAVEEILRGSLGRLPGGASVLIARDRKSTRLNSSHRTISYAVSCVKQN